MSKSRNALKASVWFGELQILCLSVSLNLDYLANIRDAFPLHAMDNHASTLDSFSPKDTALAYWGVKITSNK